MWPWDDCMYFKYGGDVLCQSVMSQLYKCISVGSASLAFSMCIHQINVTRQKHPICISDSLVGAKVCESVLCVSEHAWCVQRKGDSNSNSNSNSEENKQWNRERKKERGRASKSQGLEEFSVIYIYTFWSPQIPTLIKRNQLKLSSFNVYLN